MRRIIGNLDFETRLAIENAGASRRRPAALPSIAPAVLDTVSSFATLLRALASDGDHLWTPRRVDPARVEVVPGLPRPVLESGPEAGLRPASALLAWGETAEIARRRARRKLTGRSDETDPVASAATFRSIHPIADWLWSCPPPPAAAVARVNDRSFHLEVARDLGLALPGARLLGSMADLERHLSDGGAAASPSGAWVLKAPFSAAGRERLRGSGPTVGSSSSRGHAANLFARYGSLLFEPWLDRTDDFGCCALLDERECRIVSLHRQEVDVHGRMTGLELSRSAAPRGVIEEESTIRTVVEDVGRALLDAEYRGPFGIDGWWHRDAGGQRMLHPLGEINARMSFGLVARVLLDRIGADLQRDDFDRWILRFGDPDRRRAAVSGHIISLVRPAGGAGGAWVEMAG